MLVALVRVIDHLAHGLAHLQFALRAQGSRATAADAKPASAHRRVVMASKGIRHTTAGW